ncbi:MAG: hypothetical protein PUK70_01040 [Bacteroidales bacterium]|nr:hypothetical protein [Bacteroidales bacterium]
MRNGSKYSRAATTAIFAVMLSLLLPCSCRDYRVGRRMKAMMENPIVIPERLSTAWRDTVITGSVALCHPLLVIHVDSSYCSTCVIPKLNRYSPLYAQSLSEGTFRLAVIVSSPHGEARHICHQVGLHHFDFPVYVDLENEFDLLNPSIPSDRRFHSFLTDSLGRPRLIGDPTASEHLMKIFNEVLKSEDKTK